jgi:ATP-dependent protease ClpP protease subunit
MPADAKGVSVTQQHPKSLDEAKLFTELALAEKHRQEASDFRAAQELKAAETRRQLAEALNAEYAAELTRISRDQALRQEGIIMAANHHHHLYEFTEKVSDDTVESCLAQLAIWDRQDPECGMTVVLRSPGGSVIAGNHLFDQIALYSKRPWDTRDDFPRGSHHTVGIVRGWAASMAGVLVQAFDERVSGPTATLMLHEAATWSQGKVSEIKDDLKYLEQLDKTTTDWFMARIDAAKLANPEIRGLTRDELVDRQTRKEWYVPSKEALDLGLIDRIG